MEPEQNVNMSVEGSTLVIRVELEGVSMRPSRSGKTKIIATTSGNIAVPQKPSIKLGLNVYTK